MDGDGLIDAAYGANSLTGSSAQLFSFSGRSQVSPSDAFATIEPEGDLMAGYLYGVPDLDADGREEVAVGWFDELGHTDESETTLFTGDALRGTVTRDDAFRRSWYGGHRYTSEDMVGDDALDLLMDSGEWVYVIDGSRLLP